MLSSQSSEFHKIFVQLTVKTGFFSQNDLIFFAGNPSLLIKVTEKRGDKYKMQLYTQKNTLPDKLTDRKMDSQLDRIDRYLMNYIKCSYIHRRTLPDKLTDRKIDSQLDRIDRYLMNYIKCLFNGSHTSEWISC